MANKEKIDYLLLDIKELETLIAGMRDAEVYPVSFFSQTFNLTHKILNDLHSLETAQIEMLRKQMEAHQALIQSLPNPVATAVPAPEEYKPEVKESPSSRPRRIRRKSSRKSSTRTPSCPFWTRTAKSSPRKRLPSNRSRSVNRKQSKRKLLSRNRPSPYSLNRYALSDR